MAFKVEKDGPRMIAKERLCLTSDRKTVVAEDDPRAAFLLAAKGQVIPKNYEAQCGSGESAPVTTGTEPERRSTRPARPHVTR